MTQAICFPEQDRIELVDYSPPAIGPDELLVRAEYSGVSQGTETWALQGKRRELAFPTVPGYQTVGRIEQVGEAAGDYQVGQRVLFHRSRLTEDWTETWMAGHVGLACVPVDNDPPPRVVPDSVDPIAAALAAMPAVSLRGNQMLNINTGDLAVVLGQGLIGQAAAQLARIRGAIVLAADTNDQRLALSRQHSADYTMNPAKESLTQRAQSIRPEGADVVIDTTGRANLFPDFIDAMRLGGQLLFQGWYPDPISFDFHETHLKRPTIAITCGIGDTAAILDLMQHSRLAWRPLITDVVAVSEAPAIYERLAKGDPEVLGVVFDWSKP